MNKRLNFGGVRITDPDRIATLVRRALAEVCTVPVLIVNNGMRSSVRGQAQTAVRVLFGFCG